MAEYYVFATEAEAVNCMNYINGTEWFPITGKKNGVPAPESQKTTCWCTSASEMTTGEWAIPRIPANRLDAIGVPQGDRDAFIAAFGQDIRELSRDDFVQEEV
jgi:hypothetical protein